MRDIYDEVYFALETELISARRLLIKGFEEVDKLGYTNSFIDAALLLLSFGFERLLKSLILIDYVAGGLSSGNYDDKCRLCKKYFSGVQGHDLTKLHKEVIRIVETKDYVSSFNGGEKEFGFVKNDVLLADLIELLTDFAKGDRYYNLNVIMGMPVKNEDPETAWSLIEMMVIVRSERLMQLSREEKREELFKEVSIKFKKTLVRYMIALTWLYMVGDYGKVGEYLKFALNDFTYPHDEVLYE
jgi:hypothetical protein